MQRYVMCGTYWHRLILKITIVVLGIFNQHMMTQGFVIEQKKLTYCERVYRLVSVLGHGFVFADIDNITPYSIGTIDKQSFLSLIESPCIRGKFNSVVCSSAIEHILSNNFL